MDERHEMGFYRFCPFAGVHEMWLATSQAKWAEIFKWCRENTKGGWRVKHLSHPDARWIQFYEKNDAMMFRLTWYGNL